MWLHLLIGSRTSVFFEVRLFWTQSPGLFLLMSWISNVTWRSMYWKLYFTVYPGSKLGLLKNDGIIRSLFSINKCIHSRVHGWRNCQGGDENLGRGSRSWVGTCPARVFLVCDPFFPTILFSFWFPATVRSINNGAREISTKHPFFKYIVLCIFPDWCKVDYYISHWLCELIHSLNLYSLGSWIVFVNLPQSRLTWEEGLSIEKFPPSDHRLGIL